MILAKTSLYVVQALYCSSRRLHALCQEQALWAQLYIRDFGERRVELGLRELDGFDPTSPEAWREEARGYSLSASGWMATYQLWAQAMDDANAKPTRQWAAARRDVFRWVLLGPGLASAATLAGLVLAALALEGILKIPLTAALGPGFLGVAVFFGAMQSRFAPRSPSPLAAAQSPIRRWRALPWVALWLALCALLPALRADGWLGGCTYWVVTLPMEVPVFPLALGLPPVGTVAWAADTLKRRRVGRCCNEVFVLGYMVLIPVGLGAWLVLVNVLQDGTATGLSWSQALTPLEGGLAGVMLCNLACSSVHDGSWMRRWLVPVEILCGAVLAALVLLGLRLDGALGWPLLLLPAGLMAVVLGASLGWACCWLCRTLVGLIPAAHPSLRAVLQARLDAPPVPPVPGGAPPV
ncbi:hypothetical protein PAPYR_1905 [Paratrimastix pyriformis]|uniref:Uncharacterized protein n=1 Tax=Paratrimastix pyriformis TaxID=342808 RepID=A0ABQ8UWN0_9EUKA|nr:hypothetical protein PAPYR_1905 [Paratrimastix pyriformis]